MRGAEGVVLALVAARKAGDAAELAQRRHAVAPAGQHLVRIGLVADVPDDAVVRRVEDVVQGDRQLDGAEVRRQVAAGLRHALHHELAQLGGELLQLGARQAPHVGGRGDASRAACGSWSRWCQLALAIDDAVGEHAQALHVGEAARVEGGARGLAQLVGAVARRLEAEHADVGRLVVVESPCRRSCRAWPRPGSRRGCRRRPGTPGRRLRRSRPAPATASAWWRRRRRPSARWPAAARRSCAGACRRAPARRAAGRCWPGRSPGRRPCRRRRPPAPAARTGAPAAAGADGRGVGRQHLESQRLHGVAGEHRLGDAELHVHRRLAAAKHVVVHAGQVVVDQRIGVDQLDRAGRAQAPPRARRGPPGRRPARAAAAGVCRRRARRSASHRRGRRAHRPAPRRPARSRRRRARRATRSRTTSRRFMARATA